VGRRWAKPGLDEQWQCPGVVTISGRVLFVSGAVAGVEGYTREARAAPACHGVGFTRADGCR